MDVKLGALVFSKAGRDKLRPFVVVSVLDSDFVLIADGKLRRIDKPKKKKIKHLSIEELIFDEIQGKLSRNIKINDAEIRKALEVIQRNL